MVEVKFVEIQVGRKLESFLHLHNETWVFHAKHFGITDSKSVDLDAIRKQFVKEYKYNPSEESLLVRCYASLGDYNKEVYERLMRNRK